MGVGFACTPLLQGSKLECRDGSILFRYFSLSMIKKTMKIGC